MPEHETLPIYQRIYATVRRIPCGRVATYGQVAKITGGCTARMVGYAMAALPEGLQVPWHRVINRQGKVSERKRGEGALCQRRMLEAEGLRFDAKGRLDLQRVGWRTRSAPGKRIENRGGRGHKGSPKAAPRTGRKGAIP
jgi:methylated-DNA-protein-cysteine methyltransferase-like protein